MRISLGDWSNSIRKEEVDKQNVETVPETVEDIPNVATPEEPEYKFYEPGQAPEYVDNIYYGKNDSV